MENTIRLMDTVDWADLLVKVKPAPECFKFLQLSNPRRHAQEHAQNQIAKENSNALNWMKVFSALL